MKEIKTSNDRTGVGVIGLLQVAFIVLKLCNIIKWTWLWVLAPTWVSLILYTIIVILLFVYLN